MKPSATHHVDYVAGNAVLHLPGYRHRMNAIRPVGELIRDWRQRRGLTQLHLADLADTSTRHVSFIETGRSLPSRAMLLRLADRLDVPLRERNVLMTAAGLAPIYAERRIKDDPALAQARSAVELVLRGHEPYPAIAIDRHWNLLARNRAMGPLHDGTSAPFLLEPPLNVLRLSLHPEGLAPRIVNLGEWRAHLLHRLRHQADATGDPVLHALHQELSGYPGPDAREPALAGGHSFAVPMRLRTPLGVLSFISTTTVFGTPMDVTLAELAIESFFPADEATAALLQAAMASQEWPDGRWEPEPAR
ncbi:MAG TPA: helix-turn-helix transcriptional regulator [Lysobacter sp.]|nr:helix-turn-helix transcriptional regulator [Lysobacter sp.]